MIKIKFIEDKSNRKINEWRSESLNKKTKKCYEAMIRDLLLKQQKRDERNTNQQKKKWRQNDILNVMMKSASVRSKNECCGKNHQK